MKRLACLLMFALAGCSQGHDERVVLVVEEIYEDTAPLGCMGTNWVTLARSTDGRVERLCGRWGQPGAKIAGCWTTGHWDSIRNGFRRNC